MKLLGLLLGFWFLGVIFGAGVVDCLWAHRDGDGLEKMILNTAVVLVGTIVLFVLVAVKQRPARTTKAPRRRGSQKATADGRGWTQIKTEKVFLSLC